MGLWELFFIAVGLSMDAFAVSICKGLAAGRAKIKHMLICGAYFGAFQAVMPLIGYFLGAQFSRYIEAYDHWVAFALLVLIGGNMIREALSKEEEKADAAFNFKSMVVLAIATSVDALAVGVSFACLSVDIIPAVLFIGVITFVISAAGVKIGSIFGAKFRAKAELAGGVILVLIGVKILLEHLGIISF